MFKEAWNKYFQDIPMLGWKLREQKKELWFRIHSLPKSKRYPDNESEKSILLARHNEIAEDVLGSKSDLFLYWYGVKSFHGITGIEGMRYEDEDIATTLYSAKVGCWKSGRFDKVILAVANDDLSQIIFLNPSTGDAYAPYDGGADIIITNQEHKKTLKTRYCKWSSELESGL